MSGPGRRGGAAAAYTELIREVFRLNGQLIARGDELTRGESLTSARWQVLGALAARPATVAQLARELEITRQSVQRTVNSVLAAGLAELIDNPNHRRAKLVGLTVAGEAARTRLRPIQAAWAAEVTDGFTESELHEAVLVLRRIRGRLGAEAAAANQPQAAGPADALRAVEPSR